jgi:peptidoglycan/xylan/chitin deacetylase (PgdA/CDA1 family)
MRERFKDLIAGILSVFIIGLIFYFYFLNLIAGDYTFKVGTEEIMNYHPLKQNSCHITATKPTIIMRMDDVRAYSVPTPYLIDEVISRKLAMTLAVIPIDLEKDGKMRNYLLFVKDNPRIEIAQHGDNHVPGESNISQYDLIEGNLKIQKLLGVIPVTYTPPYNSYTPEARKVIEEYFNVLSGEDYQIIKEGEDLAEIGYTVSTYIYSKHEIVPVDSVVEQCKNNLDKTNLCVIMIHPQEYSTNINSPDTLSPKRLEDFKSMLDKLQALNATFSTFKDIVSCDDPKNQINFK